MFVAQSILPDETIFPQVTIEKPRLVPNLGDRRIGRTPWQSIFELVV
jgi:hypothetical protein